MASALKPFLKLILAFTLLNHNAYAQAQCETNNTKPQQCSRTECSTLRVCFPGTETAHTTITCPPERRFCRIGLSSDFCSSRKDPRNPACATIADSQTVCLSTGFIPDPVDCSKYYICTRDDLTGNIKDAQNCPPRMHFNTRTFNCGPAAATCYRPNCTVQGLFPYVANNAYFYMCSPATPPTDPLRINVARCANGETFNEEDGCFYPCIIPGRFPHQNQTLYYECNRANGRMEYEIRSCGRTGRFDAPTRLCDRILV